MIQTLVQLSPLLTVSIKVGRSPYTLFNPESSLQGVQICATFDTLPGLNELTQSTTTGLILNAGYDHSSGFSLDIQLPVLRQLHLGDGITSTGLELCINTGTRAGAGATGPT